MDNFREWLSDNLRYFMLGGVILVIAAVLFFGIRACVGSNKGNSGQGQNTAAENQGNVPSSPTKEGESDEKKEDANPMEKADADMTALMESYYKALGEQDIATLKTLEDGLTPQDESKITNAKEYIERYELQDVYTKQGLTEDSYVVYARIYYICQGFDTKVPALSWLYVYKDSGGKLTIDNDAVLDKEISAYVDKLSSEDAEVRKLISERQQELDQVEIDDPALAEFLDGLGEDVTTKVAAAESNKTLTATDDCNVRDAANMDADILGVISAGTQVEEKGTEGEWTKVDYEGRTGYVYSSLLE